MEKINKKRHRSEYILCLFAPLSGCVPEAVPAKQLTVKNRTVKKEGEKKKKKQKLCSEIGKFPSLKTKKREVVWFCIVV